MKFFIAHSFEHRQSLKSIIRTITATLHKHNHTSIVFAERELTNVSNQDMMHDAITTLKACDALLVESSTKEVGVGIEMGAAYVLHKPIYLVRKKGSKSSTTMEGVSTSPPIEYTSTSDLSNKLSMLLETLAA